MNDVMIVRPGEILHSASSPLWRLHNPSGLVQRDIANALDYTKSDHVMRTAADGRNSHYQSPPQLVVVARRGEAQIHRLLWDHQPHHYIAHQFPDFWSFASDDDGRTQRQTGSAHNRPIDSMAARNEQLKQVFQIGLDGVMD